MNDTRIDWLLDKPMLNKNSNWKHMKKVLIDTCFKFYTEKNEPKLKGKHLLFQFIKKKKEKYYNRWTAVTQMTNKWLRNCVNIGRSSVS